MKEPQLTEQDIRHWVSAHSFSKGQHYYEQNTIMSPWQQGNLLKAGSYHRYTG